MERRQEGREKGRKDGGQEKRKEGIMDASNE